VWKHIARNLELSVRELQIVRGTFDDRTESAMAAEFHIAPSTVHTHMERLHHKLSIVDRSQLILRVVQEYLALTTSRRNRLPPRCDHRVENRHPFSLNGRPRFRRP